jgi:hypothetical protein
MALQFSDTKTKQGLIQECETNVFGDNGYGRISGDDNLLATFTRLLNEGLNSVVQLILQSDNRWQWDDDNNTDFPIATTTLGVVVGSEQQDYTLAVSHLKITRVEVKDANGNWNLLKPIDQADIYSESLTDFLKTAGLPLYYDKIATSILLYPKPLGTQVTAVNGLKVYFQRPPSYFVSTDTTKVPGFNSLHHRLVALKASLDYARTNSLPVAGGVMRGGYKTGLLTQVDEEEQKLVETYVLRNKDEHVRITAKKFNFR